MQDHVDDNYDHSEPQDSDLDSYILTKAESEQALCMFLPKDHICISFDSP